MFMILHFLYSQLLKKEYTKLALKLLNIYIQTIEKYLIKSFIITDFFYILHCCLLTVLLVYICRDEEIFARARTVSGSRSLSTEGLLYLGLHAIGKVEEGQVTTDQLISQTFKGGGHMICQKEQMYSLFCFTNAQGI